MQANHRNGSDECAIGRHGKCLAARVIPISNRAGVLDPNNDDNAMWQPLIRPTVRHSQAGSRASERRFGKFDRSRCWRGL
jgi:hypothetical protein